MQSQPLPPQNQSHQYASTPETPVRAEDAIARVVVKKAQAAAASTSISADPAAQSPASDSVNDNHTSRDSPAPEDKGRKKRLHHRTQSGADDTPAL